MYPLDVVNYLMGRLDGYGNLGNFKTPMVANSVRRMIRTSRMRRMSPTQRDREGGGGVGGY